MSANIGKNGIVTASLIDGSNKVSIMQEDIEVGRNLIIGGSGKEKKGFFKNFDITSDGGEMVVNFSETSENRYRAFGLSGSFEIPIGDYTPGETLTWSYDVMTIRKDSNLKFIEDNMGQSYTNSGTVLQAWQGVTRHSLKLPTVLNVWEHREITIKIPTTNYPQPGNSVRQAIVFGISPIVTGTLIFRLKNVKLERGSKATPWCPNPADGLGEQPAIYKSPIKANDFIEI